MTRFWQLFIKNTGLRKVVRQYMGADACPVPEGQGSWLAISIAKLTTEAPVNGGRNYDGYFRAVIKENYMLGLT